MCIQYEPVTLYNDNYTLTNNENITNTVNRISNLLNTQTTDEIEDFTKTVKRCHALINVILPVECIALFIESQMNVNNNINIECCCIFTRF